MLVFTSYHSCFSNGVIQALNDRSELFRDQALFTKPSTNQAIPRLAYNFAALQVFKYYGLFGGAAGGKS